MDNQINNYNYQNQLLAQNLSENLLQQLNNNFQENSKALIFQHFNDIIKIEYSQYQFNLLQFKLESNYKTVEFGQISLYSNTTNVHQSQFEQKDFKFKFKNQTLVIGIMENEIINDIYFGKFNFPETQLFKITQSQESSKISFANIDYQQIEIHPSIPNLLITLSMESTGQQFSIYYLQTQAQPSSIIKIFTQKSQTMLLCEAINFNIDYLNHELIYFTNIFGHLFQINFIDVYQQISKFECATNNQQYLYKKLQIFNYKSQKIQVYTQPINEKRVGNCIYFQKVPKNENIFLFFFQKNSAIELVLIKLNQSKTIILLNKEITAIQEQEQKLQKLQEKFLYDDLDILNKMDYQNKQRQLIIPIQKYLQNQIEIDYLYFYYKQILIQIQITQEISVKTLSFDNSDRKQDQATMFISIDQAIPLDYCYYHFLILKIIIEDLSKTFKQSQYILFEYETLESPILHQKNDKNRYEYESYKKNKKIIQNLRKTIQKYRDNISKITSLEKLNIIEGELNSKVLNDLNPVVESIGVNNDTGNEQENNLVFQIYQNNNEIIKILNEYDYQANIKKLELSQLKITSLFDQYQIQKIQYEKIKEQHQKRKLQDENNLREQIINQILSIKYQQIQDSFN